MTMAIVDSHTHVIASDTAAFPLAPIGGRQSDWSATRPVNHAGLIAAMDAAGVAQSVVVQASTAYGHDNAYLAEAIALYPRRLTGVFSVDVLSPDAPAVIRHWYGRGLIGFRLFTTGTTMPGQADWLDAEATFPAWALAQEMALPICLQMTAQGIPALRQMLVRFPGVAVVLDHLARPDLSDGPPYARAASLFDLAAYPQVHLKLTSRALDLAAQGRSSAAALLAALLPAFGAARILWGSNFPAAEGGLPHLVAEARSALAGLGPDEQTMILGGTARRLYPSLTGG